MAVFTDDCCPGVEDPVDVLDAEGVPFTGVDWPLPGSRDVFAANAGGVLHLEQESGNEVGEFSEFTAEVVDAGSAPDGSAGAGLEFVVAGTG
ncbi:MAG: hypothetical protein HOY79_17970 [Streptomyces sp.]|nr:hypothetical protein [Streptomyces sp.]